MAEDHVNEETLNYVIRQATTGGNYGPYTH